MRKIITIVGARPQFIKAATLSRIFQQSDKIVEKIIHTGQHFDDQMSDIFFKELHIPAPSYHLGINNTTQGAMTGRMLEKIESILLKEQPNGLLVYGDTNSTLAGALAASKLHIPVIHIEAGLRSFNKRMPEEINRILTDHISRLLLCPTHSALQNLAAENITEGTYHVGDVMYDATLYAKEHSQKHSHILEQFKLKPKDYALATIHRQENTDDPDQLRRVFAYLEAQAENSPLLLPLHPRTKKYITQYGITLKNIQICEPLSYFDMHALLGQATKIYTDSGGLQKEAYFHQVPCITLREETEWIETIAHGWNCLWKETPSAAPTSPILDYGTGKAAEACYNKICDILL